MRGLYVGVSVHLFSLHKNLITEFVWLTLSAMPIDVYSSKNPRNYHLDIRTLLIDRLYKIKYTISNCFWPVFHRSLVSMCNISFSGFSCSIGLMKSFMSSTVAPKNDLTLTKLSHVRNFPAFNIIKSA